jgi:conjugal transfer pilus assembly protein TraW
VHTADGTVLVRAGDQVNPLDRLPFTQRLVVFDAAIRARWPPPGASGGRPASGACSTSPPRSSGGRGWDGLAAVEDTLDAPVYLLTPDVRARFALERVPATVEARGRVFVVAEVPPEDAP